MSRARSCLEPGRCRSCAELILWVEWESGRKMPIDVAPRPDGNVYVVHRASQNKLIARKTGGPTQNKYVSHFSSCPNASEHRR